AAGRGRAGLRAGEAAIGGVLARKLGVEEGDSLRLELQGRALSLRVGAVVNDYLFGGRVAYLDQASAANMVALGPTEVYIVQARSGVPLETLLADLEALASDEGLVV